MFFGTVWHFFQMVMWFCLNFLKFYQTKKSPISSRVIEGDIIKKTRRNRKSLRVGITKIT